MLGPVELVDEVDSTNAELLRREADGAPAGVVLVARRQTAGRGRLGRRWEAPAGSSLLVSVLLRPSLEPERLHLVTHAVALAARQACIDTTGVAVSLKWPNDLVVEGVGGTRKVAGLLTEAVIVGGAVRGVVVGMGLNVNWTSAVPEGGAALSEIVGADVDAEALLARWLELAGAGLDGLERPDGPAALLADYRACCATIGRRVRVDTGSEVVEGDAVDVDGAGHLVVGPERRTFAVGDVVHVRNVSVP